MLQCVAMTEHSRRVALAFVGGSLVACAPICDEVGVRAAAAAFTAGAERDGVEALRGACPSLPAVFMGSSLPSVREDPEWAGLVARTCPAAVHARGGVASLDELGRGVRTICALDRYGLLAADAAFVRADLRGFALYEWLVGGRVEPSLAAEVVRPLLTEHALVAANLVPPRGAIDLQPRSGGPELRVSPTMVSVDGAPVLSLEGGRAAPGVFVGHVSGSLRTALAASFARARAQAERAEVGMDSELAIVADRYTPFATLGDAMYTARKVGFETFSVVVHDGSELRGLPVGVPLEWSPPDDVIRELRLKYVFVVTPEAVTARLEGREEARFTQPAGAAIAAHAKLHKALYPNLSVATLRVDGEVPLQAVVSLIDTLAGEGCRLLEAVRGGRIPDECLFWQAVLDLDPPLRYDSDVAP